MGIQRPAYSYVDYMADVYGLYNTHIMYAADLDYYYDCLEIEYLVAAREIRKYINLRARGTDVQRNFSERRGYLLSSRRRIHRILVDNTIRAKCSFKILSFRMISRDYYYEATTGVYKTSFQSYFQSN